MGMKCGFVACLLLAISLFWMAGCTSVNNAATTGVSYLYVTAQANTTISAYTVTQSNGRADQHRKRHRNRFGAFGDRGRSLRQCFVRGQQRF